MLNFECNLLFLHELIMILINAVMFTDIKKMLHRSFIPKIVINVGRLSGSVFMQRIGLHFSFLLINFAGVDTKVVLPSQSELFRVPSFSGKVCV